MGRELPPTIANAPQLTTGLGLYLQAFWELSSCRDIGFGEGPIPWLAINRYSEHLDLDIDQELALFHHVRAMDNVYLQHQSKKSGASTSGQGKGIQAKVPNKSGSNRP